MFVKDVGRFCLAHSIHLTDCSLLFARLSLYVKAKVLIKLASRYHKLVHLGLKIMPKLSNFTHIESYDRQLCIEKF